MTPRGTGSRPIAEERGSLRLAERLVDMFNMELVCPECDGGDPPVGVRKFIAGFNRDQGGTDRSTGRPRRQWTCKRSAQAKFLEDAGGSCGRRTCTSLIALAAGVLPEQKFRRALGAARESYPADDGSFDKLKEVAAKYDKGWRGEEDEARSTRWVPLPDHPRTQA